MNIKNEKGITLVALIVSIIVMLILATVTLNTTFTAYETTRAEKFKAQLKVVQESVNSFYSDWQTWRTEKEYEYRDEFRKKEQELEKALKGKTLAEEIAQIKAEYEVPKEQQLLDDGSMPQYFYDNIAGIDEYINYKKGTYSEDISGKTLAYLNGRAENGEETPEQIVNEECYLEVKEKLDEVINIENDFSESEENDTENSENTDNGKSAREDNDETTSETLNNTVKTADDTIFYEFNEESLEAVLGLRDIDIPVFINFENLVIFTTKPVRVSGQKIYTQYSFNDSGAIILNDTNSTMQGAAILIDVKANYGTSQKITLTLEPGSVNDKADKNNYVDYKIRKAYYQNAFVNAGEIEENVTNWKEVDTLKECEYSEDGKSVTFIIYESGSYRFRLEDVSGAYTVEMKRNTKTNIKNPDNQYSYEKIEDKNVDDDSDIEKAVYNITLCNAPVLNEDMIPVKWVYNDESKNDGKWVVCTTIDSEWYNYSEDSKMWANVMLAYDSTATNLSKGTELSEKQMGSMFVWVPRFTQRGEGYKTVFLRGSSNTSTYGQTFETKSKALVAFSNKIEEYGWDVELRGLWFAKYDTSLEFIDDLGNIQMVNSSVESTAETFNKIYSSEQPFRAVSKPYRITWRNISFSSAFSQALMYYSKLPSASKNRNLNSHMMTYSEWDVLKYITSNTKLGIGKDNLKANTSNKYAGGSDGTSGYTIANFTNQTSNGNMTGIFDVIGTTKVMTPVVDIIKVEGDISTHSEFIYNNLGEPINRFINDIDEFLDNSPSKYIGLMDNSTTNNSTIRLAENGISIPYEHKTIEECVNHNIGFRIVIANSASGDRDNFVYDNTNLTEVVGEDLPGFYVTDENGNYIRNEFGEYKDSNGNPTFYSWETMIANRWINFRNGTVEAGANISKLKEKTGILVIAENVVTIGEQSFNEWNSDTAIDDGDKGLLKLVMQNQVTSVGKKSFKNCNELFEIKFSDNLKTIDDDAFNTCSSLVNFDLPFALETIGVGAFYKCTSIESVTIPHRVSNIGQIAFSKNYNLSNLQFQSEVESLNIGAYCFDNSAITSVVIPGNISEISACMFFGCKKLETIVIEEGVTGIRSKAFFKCTNLKDVKLPSTLNYIEYQVGMFEECISLEKIDFRNCTQLEKIPAQCFKGCTSLATVYLPIDCLEIIGQEAFYNCSSLTTLKIPETLSEVGEDSFGFEEPSDEKITLIYGGTLSSWEKIYITSSTPGDLIVDNELWSKKWYKNITVEVWTEDGETITYDENGQT